MREPMLSIRQNSAKQVHSRSACSPRRSGAAKGDHGDEWETVDFFSDESLSEDPYPYFDYLRSQCPVLPTDNLGVVAVSGYEEALEIYLDPETFSSCNSVIGPFATFPVPLEGDDVGGIIDGYRDQLPMNEHMVTMDPPMHTQERALVMRLLTPKRLQENEAFMWGLADRQIDEFIGAGRCEFISAYSQPFAMLAVADVLGVPQVDHQRFRDGFGLSGNPGRTRWRRGHRAECLGLARQLVRPVHRGPPARAPPGRADAIGARNVLRRDDPRSDCGGADSDVPVCRRPGDDRSPARCRAEVSVRVPRAPGRASGAPRPGSRLH